MDVKTQLIIALATELAVTLELYEDLPEAWMPESLALALALIDEAVAYLTQHGHPLPDAVEMIQRRRMDRAA